MDVNSFLEGNVIFAENINRQLLLQLAEEGQKPVVTVISCSDSRVPIEIIFNQLEPGKLFVIRVAGNVVADSSVKGSIEYAIEHLKTPYLFVVGHTQCGAVMASLEGVSTGEIGRLVSNIKLESKELSLAVVENINIQVKRIMQMGCVKEAIGHRVLEVYGMLYDLKTGAVKVLSKNGICIT